MLKVEVALKIAMLDTDPEPPEMAPLGKVGTGVERTLRSVISMGPRWTVSTQVLILL